MKFIGLFMPAIVSLMIRNRKQTKADWRMPQVFFQYGIYVLLNVWLTECIITYGLGLSDVIEDALTSFPFFTKYTLIALVMAVVVPYAEEIVRKYVSIRLTVETYDEKRESSVEDSK